MLTLSILLGMTATPQPTPTAEPAEPPAAVSEHVEARDGLIAAGVLVVAFTAGYLVVVKA